MNVVKLLPLLLAAGCAAVGPEYERPQMALQQDFVGGTSGPVAQVAAKAWWQDYRDPMLSDFIARGLSQNLDVAAARERIRQAEANLRATGVNAALDGALDASRTRSGGEASAISTASASDLSASLVLDMFGGIRREQQAAAADLSAARSDLQQARLAWLADLVAAYSDARYYQQALALSRNTINSRVETVRVTQDQYDAGAETEYNLAQAQALLDAARADLPGYHAQFNANVFALATLLNEPAGPLMAQMEKGAPQLRTPAGGATGVPADLLRNRPDVRYYEQLLQAAVADVGVAEADRLPSLTLSGDLGVTSGTSSWSFGPALSLPLLNQGLLSAKRDAAISEARQAEIDWRSSVRGAVEDVQVAQSNLSLYRQKSNALQTSAASYERALGLARDNYRGGAITLLDLLDTDRSAASARISAASARNDAAKEWATLQIAIGAGAGVSATGGS
ncbi:efflux transporter outer membrane subunit [Alloyangia pacifica]|uniref:efflux transporter outer membrane subunit n=1 Tax=Alloyangia pacifica TaxID=311180 RepID=UPI001CD5B590|nr:efflux transporter outer membrane subunit [Alloyangia pacifica]MCA0996120.1 efflux transporter outer membrane subunit [Alloyangia pacifica]